MVRKSELKAQIKQLESQVRRLEDAAYRLLTTEIPTKGHQHLQLEVDSVYAGCDGWGYIRHPETGEKADKGRQWVRHLMDKGYVLESIGTPYYCSVSSETYWAS